MVDTVDAVEAEYPDANITLHVGFLMMPEYTLSTFSNAISVLRMANRLSGRELYRYSVFSLDGEPLSSSSGIEIRLDGSLKSVDEHECADCVRWLQRQRLLHQACSR